MMFTKSLAAFVIDDAVSVIYIDGFVKLEYLFVKLIYVFVIMNLPSVFVIDVFVKCDAPKVKCKKGVVKREMG